MLSPSLTAVTIMLSPLPLCSQAAKAYEKHCAENGKPDSHAKAKEIMAGFAGAFIDRMVETKGVRCSHFPIATGWLTLPRYNQLDFVDRERAKRHAKDKVEEVVTVETY